jgi:hypothetical protein
MALVLALGCGPANKTTAPTITALPAPNVYPNPATLTGTGLDSVTAISIGSVPVPYVSGVSTQSATQITFQVPADAVTGPISVTNPGGTATSTTDFIVEPTLLTSTPSGPPETTVTVSGYGLAGVDQVNFTFTTGGPVYNPAITSQSAEQLTFAVPSLTITGSYTVVLLNPYGLPSPYLNPTFQFTVN